MTGRQMTILLVILVFVFGLLIGNYLSNRSDDCLEDEVAWWVDSYAGHYYYRTCVPMDDLIHEFSSNQS